ncbi:MAG: hypothetical protein CW691_05640, partial [Candidatus Bathyarchaeum sp.]
NIQIDGSRHFKAIANDGFSRSTAEFLRINSESPVYWADPSYIIHDGIVRDIVQTEAEYGDNGIPGCPNVYAQIVLTFPANSNYYSYSVRTIFVTDATRNLNDLSVLQLDIDPGTAGVGDLLTEDGIDGDGLPITSSLEDTFYNATYWQHHWSQFTRGTRGAGVMFSDEANVELYAFDGSSTKTGALVVEKQEWDESDGYIEINPVEVNAISFDYPQDLIWHGAVVTFDGDPIYDGGDESGLWVMIGYPPVITVDAPEDDSGVNYVDTNLSDVDSSADKGSHSAFLAQKSGPDSVCDTLTEEDTVGSGGVTLIDAESFEGSWLPTGWSEDPGSSNWAAETTESYDGSYSADFDGFGNGVSGSLVTPELDCSDATSISVAFWYYDDNIDPNEFVLEYYDGSSWFEIDDLGVYSESTWNLYVHEITDSRYFVSDFKVRWHAIDVEGGSSNEHAYVDLVTVTKYTSQPPNYELDLEVRWTTLDFDETNEELCIYVGEVGAENLAVDVWYESAWVNVFSSLEVGWNNATISSYLTSSTLTIRFIAQTETGDTTPDYWTIDATLIHCWS